VKRDPYASALARTWVAQLVQEREKRGITVAQLASTLGCSHANVREWEIGEHMPRVETLIRWAEALGRELQLVESVGSP
jgi:transcriptional regulator with XRE-family HTH domain